MRPTIADNVDAGMDKAHGHLHFVFVNSREELVVAADPLTVQLVNLMDGTRTIRELTNAVRGRAQQKEVARLVTFLCKNRVVVDATSLHALPSSLLAFQRQIQFFSDFSRNPAAIQKMLAKSNVGIVGLGTIGGMIASQLCRMGVGSITTVDPDNVSASNLARHSLFTAADVGESKVTATRRALKAVRPALHYSGRQTVICSEADIARFASDCSLVINCADQPSVAQTSEWVGCACMKTHTPHILAGGYRTHLGFLGPTVLPFKTACWKCFADDYKKNDPFGKLGWKPLVSSRVSGGSIMPLAAIVASVHVWEAVRVLTGLLPPMLCNRKAEINYTDLGLTWYEVLRNPSCCICARHQ